MHEALNPMTRTVPDIRLQQPTMIIASMMMPKRGRSTDPPLQLSPSDPWQSTEPAATTSLIKG
jgi:hypothetical protein